MCGVFAFALCAMGAVAAAAEKPAAGAGGFRVFLGTYTRGASKGIYVSRLDPATGALAAPELAAEANNASFVAVDPSRRFLFAVSEVNRFNNQPGGARAPLPSTRPRASSRF